jgi:hypothetical protein
LFSFYEVYFISGRSFVINKIPTTNEIDLVEREQEEAINKTPATDEIGLIERTRRGH